MESTTVIAPNLGRPRNVGWIILGIVVVIILLIIAGIIIFTRRNNVRNALAAVDNNDGNFLGNLLNPLTPQAPVDENVVIVGNKRRPVRR